MSLLQLIVTLTPERCFATSTPESLVAASLIAIANFPDAPTPATPYVLSALSKTSSCPLVIAAFVFLLTTSEVNS